MRWRPLIVVAGPLALLLFVGWYQARLRAGRQARIVPPRVPAHKPELPRDAAPVRETLEEVEALRVFRRQRDLPVGGVGHPEYERRLDKVRSAAARNLHYLEEIVLDKNENSGLRVELLNLIAAHPGEETRLVLAALMGDAADHEGVRIAAIYPLMAYKDRATFEAFERAWQDPAPFRGRYHLLVALGENGHPGALSILRDALSETRPLTERAHAAQGLGGFADDPAVRADLRRLATADPVPAVRQNAVRAIARSTLPEAESVLKDVLARAPDAETRRVAQAFLDQRAKKP